MGSQSAVHRVLDIPELLDLVFRLLDHKSNLNNACVSHRWTEIGLNNLWRSVDSASQIIHLFSKLAPLEYELAVGNVCRLCMISRTCATLTWTSLLQEQSRKRVGLTSLRMPLASGRSLIGLIP